MSLAAAQQVARAGGNAVDVAVAAALAAMSTEPGIVSLAGGAFVSVGRLTVSPVVIDGNVEMPGRGLPVDRFGGGVREVVTDYGGGVHLYAGHGSVATPGAVDRVRARRRGAGPAAVGATSSRPPRRPAATATPSGGGGPLPRLHRALPVRARPRGPRVVTRADGSPLEAGDVVTNHRLAEVLDLVGRDGASVLTTGEVGRAMVADMEANGGLVTHRDLAEYTPLVRPPVRRKVGDWDLAVNPPPSVGGPMLAVMLGELGRRGDWHWPDIIEIQRAVLRYRREVHDSPHDLDAAGHELLLSVDRHGLAGLPTSASTANVSVVDADGTACAVTDVERLRRRHHRARHGDAPQQRPRRARAQPAGAAPAGPRHPARIQHGARPRGAPRDGRVLAIGSPGADRITTALMLVLGQGCLHGADLRHAIEAPRLHVRFDEDGVAGRRPRERPRDHRERRRAAGAARRRPRRPQMYFGGVGAAYRRDDGSLEAAGDPRREAAVAVLDA